LSEESTSGHADRPVAERWRLKLKPVAPASMPHALGSLGVSVVAGAVFLWLSNQVMTSATIVSIDAAAFDLVLSLHTPWLTTIVSITRIGNTSTLTVRSIVAGFGWRRSSRRRLIAFVRHGAALLNMCSSTTARPRPKSVSHEHPLRFPSGHHGSMLFGSLAYVAVTLETHRARAFRGRRLSGLRDCHRPSRVYRRALPDDAAGDSLPAPGSASASPQLRRGQPEGKRSEHWRSGVNAAGFLRLKFPGDNQSGDSRRLLALRANPLLSLQPDVSP
jgi:hypothetical protein